MTWQSAWKKRQQETRTNGQSPRQPRLRGGLAVLPREDQITIMTDHLTQAAGTVRGVLDDLTGLPVTASRAEQTAAILDNLAAELKEAAADLRQAARG